MVQRKNKKYGRPAQFCGFYAVSLPFVNTPKYTIIGIRAFRKLCVSGALFIGMQVGHTIMRFQGGFMPLRDPSLHLYSRSKQ